MTKQKPYKLEYKFIKQLRDLLTGEDWRTAHLERIAQLQELLSHSHEEPALAKRAEMAADGKVFPEENFNRMVTAEAKRQEDKRVELAQIEANLVNDTYTMGIAPFETKGDAQQMLKALHILEIDSERYNQEAVVAIRNMLSENFADLYTAEIGVKVSEPPVPTVDKNGNIVHEETIVMEEPLYIVLNKILAGAAASIEDIIADTEDVTENDLNEIRIFVTNCGYIERAELPEIADIINFVMHFYRPESLLTPQYILSLSMLFHSTTNLERFFTKFVDFSTIESLEQTLPIGTLADFSRLSPEELNTWRDLMIEHGPKAMTLFGQANTLSQAGINVALVTQEAGAQRAFEIIRTEALKTTFARESENPELAELCRKYYISETVFNETLESVIPAQKTSDDLPDISFEFSVGSHNYRFEKLQPGDLNGLFLGKMTDCCQFIDGDAKQCAIDGFTREDAGFYVIRDEKGKIKAQSYAWLGVVNGSQNAVIFDSFEYLTEAEESFLPAMLGYRERLATQEEPLMVAVGTGGKTPSTYDPKNYDSTRHTDVKPQNSDLFQYRDSSEVVEIMPETVLYDSSSASERSMQDVMFSSYQDLLSHCARVNLKILKEKYPSEILAIKDSSIMHGLYDIHTMALFLTEEGILDIKSIIKLIESRPEVINKLSQHHNTWQEHYKQLFLQCKEQGMTDQEKIMEFVFSTDNDFDLWIKTRPIIEAREKHLSAAEVEEPGDADTQSASVAAEVAPPAISEQMLKAMQRCLQNFQPVEIIKLDPVEMQVENMSTQDIIDTKIAKECIETHQSANFNTVLKYVSEVNLQDQEGKTLLILSVIYGFTHGVKALLAKNADKTIVDSMGLNAVEYAHLHHPELVEMLTTTETPIELTGATAEDFS